LVECGLAAGLGPADFGLQRIGVGGEVVTAGLKARCQALFGVLPFVEGYAMTRRGLLAERVAPRPSAF